MEIIIITATIVGLIAGFIAISDKAKEFLFKKNRIKHIFDKEFNDWKDSGRLYMSPRDIFLQMRNFIETNRFDDEREAFCLSLGTHYGDDIFHELIRRNQRNEQAYSVLFNMLDKKGVRVGWRAEYALSTMDENLMNACIESLPSEFLHKDRIKESMHRIRSKQVLQYLAKMSNEGDHTSRTYAKEVLRQIKE